MSNREHDVGVYGSPFNDDICVDIHAVSGGFSANIWFSQPEFRAFAAKVAAMVAEFDKATEGEAERDPDNLDGAEFAPETACQRGDF